MGLRVVRPGPLTLLQDGGRAEWQHLGVSPSGPADWQAAAWANRLLGNAPTAALLEINLGPLSLQVEQRCWVALCGAQMVARVDGVCRPNWSRWLLQPGQRLDIAPAAVGLRGYLAIQGGFQGTPILGSVATHVREGLGGLGGHGRPLQVGDVLKAGFSKVEWVRGAGVPGRFIPDYAKPPVVRVILGGDSRHFRTDVRTQFLQQPWQVDRRTDRMGIRLRGEPLQAPPVRSWSLGVATGTLQVPADGLPIILSADRQTMGGYPILGWVHPRDLWRLTQSPPGQALSFRAVSLAEVQQEMRCFYQFFAG